MGQETVSTKQKLLEVAEELFATQGVSATLVGDIVTGAGQRNPSALRYHFGSREGVLQAIREKYLTRIEERRATLLSGWPTPGPRDPRDAVELAVTPLAELLSSESGRRYLRILGQTMYELTPEQMDGVEKYPSLAATIALMRAGIDDLPPRVVDERIQGTLLLISAMLAIRARDMANRRRPPLPLETFTRNVISMATSTLTAPLTGE
ncbi:TetR/AcrR family transcriptional regulator [Rhodococcus sp. (in: high G+C Gram-positive bacteria)]|uniref:TetR/AcrR family transcriptional regulator n=1 Tax=Rhodococcus sp. TaxID=1831 RepID=UPI003B8A8B74